MNGYNWVKEDCCWVSIGMGLWIVEDILWNYVFIRRIEWDDYLKKGLCFFNSFRF